MFSVFLSTKNNNNKNKYSQLLENYFKMIGFTYPV